MTDKEIKVEKEKAPNTYEQKVVIKQLKEIKTEIWEVKTLTDKIKNGQIIKPKFQRKKKWFETPQTNSAISNEKDYITFLRNYKHSVNNITCGIEGELYSGIDGNNRVCSIDKFINKPFRLYPEYLENLDKIINENVNFNPEEKKKIKSIFRDISYNDITKMSFRDYFTEKYPDLYNEKLKYERDSFEDAISVIKKKLGTNFDVEVKIIVVIFKGYSNDELCSLFEKINEKDNKLTKMELYCSRLNNCYVLIDSKPIETQIMEEISEYYEKKSHDEALICHNYEYDEKINPHEFLVAFQNLCSKKYYFIESNNEKNNSENLPLFYKIYQYWRIDQVLL